jgi:pimeloyl-ACP methyl ester carboxylesterase
MSNQRTHYVTSSDGVTIGGTVHGHGPPLVFLQGIVGDGDLDWRALLPHLTDRFTCHLLNMRGRGLSDDHPDLGVARQAEDVLAYIDSIEAPTGLVGWSGGANLALLVAATRPDAVAAIAAIEPVANTVMDEHEQAALGGAVARAGELAAEGRLADAARAFAGWPFNDEDIAVAEDAGYFEAAGRYVPNLLNFFRQFREYQGPMPDDPDVLGTIQAPALVLRGTHTKPFMATSARHVADHIPNARVQEIPGAGHAAPLTRPEALAEALTAFFSPVQQPA